MSITLNYGYGSIFLRRMKMPKRIVAAASLMLLLATIMSFAFNSHYGTAGLELKEATIRIINPLSGDRHFYFNASEHPINSVFTVEFYIEDTGTNEDMIGWQITLSWNITVINYTSVWIPPDNVFKDSSYEVITPPNPFFELEGDTAYLTWGAILLIMGGAQPGDGVDVHGEALLFKANFKILQQPSEGEYIQTNLALIDMLPNSHSLDTYILTPTGNSEQPLEKVPVSAEPAQVIIYYLIDVIPPEISDPVQDPPPDNVKPFQNVTVTVNVTDIGEGVKNVTLWYRKNGEVRWHILNMTPVPSTSSTYQAEIPGFENCTWVTYKIVAYDKNGNRGVNDNEKAYFKYQVIPEFPSTITVLLLLIASTSLATLARKERFQRDIRQ